MMKYGNVTLGLGLWIMPKLEKPTLPAFEPHTTTTRQGS